jgi:predicted polyphosphate/ATP-dependent NAD kinase
MAKKIALIVNPIAGIGGPLSLKGSDGIPWGELGIHIGPSFKASVLFLKFAREVLEYSELNTIELLTPSGLMGEIPAREVGLNPKIICDPKEPTSKNDTLECSAAAVEEGAEIIIFVGGDGTAIDVLEGSGKEVLLLGVPGGTKVYSSIFARSVQAASHLFASYLRGDYITTEGEIILVDEISLRETGEFKISRMEIVQTIESKSGRFRQESKDFLASDEEEIEEIATCIAEEIQDRTPLIIGPGRTATAISSALGIKKRNVLSVSAGWKGKTFCEDCTSLEILDFSTEVGGGEKIKLILSPIGRSGFILGRGNQQIPLSVLNKIPIENLLIVATRTKAARLRRLLVDLKERAIEEKFSGYLRVRIGCNEEMVMPILPA